MHLPSQAMRAPALYRAFQAAINQRGATRIEYIFAIKPKEAGPIY